MRRLIAGTSGGDQVVWSTHCHDDLGLATANSLAGVRAGARQVEVTINGIGERAGNTSLEELVMALHTRCHYFRLETGIDTTQITRTSRMVSSATGIPVPPNKAIVGANAFAHEAGIHQDGVLKDQRTYEIMTPETVGLDRSQLVLGKHSGRHAFRIRLQHLGFELSDNGLETAFARFKQLADKKKVITEGDLHALVTDELCGPEEVFGLVDLQVTCGRPGMPTATVRLTDPGGEERVAAAIGIGPVHATFRSIDCVIGAPIKLVEYRVISTSEGVDSLGEVTVRISDRDQPAHTFSGYGADTDIIVASAKAYLGAINRMQIRLGATSTSVTPMAQVAQEEYDHAV
jgi:2-isopropylmalate synthase